MTIRLFGGDYFVGLSVAQGCRATLRGNAFGTFRRPRVPGRTLGRHFRTFLSLGGAGQNYIRMTGLFGDDTHSSSPKSTAADPSVSRTRRLAHETTSEDPPVSRMRRLAHETTSEDPPVSRTRYFAHETTSEDPPVSRSRYFAHETSLEDPSVSRTRRLAHENDSEDSPVSRTRRLAHETTSEDPSVSRTRRSAHETSLADPYVSISRLFTHETAAKDTRGNRGAFSASYGDSMETLRALYGRSSMPPRFDQSQWDS